MTMADPTSRHGPLEDESPIAATAVDSESAPPQPRAASNGGLAELLGDLTQRLRPGGLGGRVALNATRMLVVNGLGALVSFAVQIALARAMGKEAFGAYVYCTAWLGAWMLLGKLEFDTVSVRFVGAYMATSRWELLRGYLRFSRRVVLGASLAVAATAAVVVGLGSTALEAKHPGLVPAMWVTAVMLPISALLGLGSARLQGVQRYLAAQIPQYVVRPAVFGLVLGMALLLGQRSVSPSMAVAFNLAGTATALAVTLLMWRRAKPEPLATVPAAMESRVWMRTTLPLLAVAAAQLIVSQQADVIVVGTMLTASEAAGYGAASQLTLPLTLAGASAAYVAQPLIADLFARQQLDRLQRLIRISTFVALLLTLPVALVLIGGGRWLLGLFGADFASAYPVLVVLTLAQLVVGLAGALAGYLLTMTAYEREAAWIIGGSAVLNIVLAIILTPRFGAIGTAISTLVAASARALALRIVIRRLLGLYVPAVARHTRRSP